MCYDRLSHSNPSRSCRYKRERVCPYVCASHDPVTYSQEDVYINTAGSISVQYHNIIIGVNHSVCYSTSEIQPRSFSKC